MSLSENARGALVMAFAMAAFTFNDALVKSVTSELSIAQIIAVRGVMTTTLVYFIARHLRASISLKTLSHPLVLLRGFCELGATLAYFTALARLEFATAASIMQSLPLVVTLGAALVFREPVGWRRWSAIGVGLVGVLLILRPGAEGFSADAIYPLIALCFTACRDLTTRRISAEIPTISITFFTSFANTLLGIILIMPMGGWQPVSAGTFSILVLTSLLVFAGYQTVIMAMRTGEVSFVTPFRYTSLIWALAIGILFFGEEPSGSMLAGAAIVIGSGLYTFAREKKRKQQVATAADVAPPGSTQTRETGR